MNYTTAQLHEILKGLPPDVNEAIGSVDYIDTLMGMEKKYRLHIDQADALGNEIYKLMLGLIPPQEFIGQIETNARIPRETAKLIAAEVNEKIFRPVRESLMQIHKMKEGIEEDAATAAVSDVPAGEIPEEQKIKDNAKNEMEETQPVRSAPAETKNIAENKLTEPFSLSKKTDAAPDPYRETV